MAEFNNPFADPTESSNPFDDPSVRQAATGGAAGGSGEDFNPFDTRQQQQQQQQRPAVLQASNPPSYTASAQQKVTSDELDRRQRELEAKARELERREEDQRRRELQQQQQQQQANGAGYRNNNWPALPSFCPIGPCFYQDFEVDIPQEFRRLVKIGYYLWIGHTIVLLLNVIGTLAYFIASDPSHTPVAGAVFGVSLLVVLVLVPCSFVCWFRPLYKAFKSDSSFSYFMFFIIFFIQCAVLVVQLLGIDYLGSCGWINAAGMLKVNTGAAVIMLIVAAAFTVLAVIDFLLLIRVHRIYRSSGASFAKAREEFSQGVMTNDTVRSAAADAAAASARSAFSGGAGKY